MRVSRMAGMVLAFGALSWPASAVASDPLDERVSLDLVEAAPADVFASFGQIGGWQVEAEKLSKKLTIRLQAVTTRTALAAVCESIDCRWQLAAGDPPTLRITALGEAAESKEPAGTEPASARAAQLPTAGDPLEELIQMDLEAAQAADVFRSVSVLLNVELELDPALAGETFKVERKNATVRAFLDLLCHQKCAWTYSGPPQSTLRITATARR